MSVGYSTCHWCHVMERESFENEELAGLLNKNFIAIKVDREERPDVDSIYMGYVQATTGRGGWPMSVWLTPELQPFFGGTYYPPEAFRQMLSQISQLWQRDRQKITQSAGEAKKFISTRIRQSVPSAAAELLESFSQEGYQAFRSIYDSSRGGFGGAPKFPRPAVFNFLLRYHCHFDASPALDMSLITLKEMAAGGMYDHLGGGFHRYSVDERWHVPHFEKMLYDQAQLVISYVEAYQITHEDRYAQVARGVLEYVLRDLTAPEGAFYSAEDADSAVDLGHPHEKSEGAFYTWTRSEIDRILGQEDAELFSVAYGVEQDGNVGHDPQGELRGKNVIFLAATLEGLAKRFQTSVDSVSNRLQRARDKLFAERAKRPKPHLDDKILTSWNGLMVSAFARAAWALPSDASHSPSYLTAAQRAAGFILKTLYRPQEHLLLRRYRDGEAAIHGFVDDYAFFIQGLLDLYEADGDITWFETAIALQEAQDNLFWDKPGGYFSTDGRDPSIIARNKDDYDGAEPSGNSIAAMNLLRLWHMTGRKDFKGRAIDQIAWAAGGLKGLPYTQPQMLAAFLVYLGKQRQVILAGDPTSPEIAAMRKILACRFLPDLVVLYADGGAGQQKLAETLPFIKTITPLQDRATAYVCENYTCELPTNDLEQFKIQLKT